MYARPQNVERYFESHGRKSTGSARRRERVLYAMALVDLATGLRYFGAKEMEALTPSPQRSCELAAQALRWLASGEIEVPPKLGVHPHDFNVHAMPAYCKPLRCRRGQMGRRFSAQSRQRRSDGERDDHSQRRPNRNSVRNHGRKLVDRRAHCSDDGGLACGVFARCEHDGVDRHRTASPHAARRSFRSCCPRCTRCASSAARSRQRNGLPPPIQGCRRACASSLTPISPKHYTKPILSSR